MGTSRTRTVDRRKATTRTIVQVNGAAEPIVTVSHPNSYGMLETMKDNVNKGFRQAMKAGVVVLSDCVLTRSVQSYTPGSIHYDSGTYHRTDTGDLTVYLQLDTPELSLNDSNSDMSMLTLMQAYARMNQSTMLLGETVKELDSTLSMLRRPFGSACDLLGKISRRKAKLLKSSIPLAKATSRAWLEYRYGWKPLMMDIDNIIDVAHKVRSKTAKKRLVARASNKCASSGSRSTSPKYVHPQVGCTGTATASYSRRCSAGVLFSIQEMTSNERLVAELGLRPRDFGPTLWEAVPYSFVADWFSSVGTWLQAIAPVPGITPLGHWVTNVTKTTSFLSGSIAYPDPQPDASTVFHGSFGSLSSELTVFSRTCNQPLQFTPALNPRRFQRLQQVDGLALLLGKVLRLLSRHRS